MGNAVDRLYAELDLLVEQVTDLIVAEVPQYRTDEVALATLKPFVQSNADMIFSALRGLDWTPAAARNVGITDAQITDLTLESVLGAYTVAEAKLHERLDELADGEDVATVHDRLVAAFVEARAALTESFTATKAAQARA